MKPPERLTWDEKNVFRTIAKKNESDPTRADHVTLLNKTLAYISWAENYAQPEISSLEKRIEKLQEPKTCSRCDKEVTMFARICHNCLRLEKERV